jgi:serine/threonine-protein kinase HipA
VSLAEVTLWGSTIGAVSLPDGVSVASFQYVPELAASPIEPAPLQMPVADRVYRFPNLGRAAFHGLPGMLADALPDRYGNDLIDAWLAAQGRTPESFDAVERLLYAGRRAMGALEFEPARGPAVESHAIDVAALARLAAEALTDRAALVASLREDQRTAALHDILQVGTSAGGARAKAVIAWNPETNEVRSGQVAAHPGFEHWLLKFDGVARDGADELADPQGFGAVEYAYSTMARAAGIEMTPTRLLEAGDRRHFMTRRFDRPAGDRKLHLQSLAALAHLDFNQASAHAYEQAFLVIRRLGLGMEAVEEQYRRMVFNVVARNQDDHVKNVAFLMDRDGSWSLSPAFDLMYAYNPTGTYTAEHQMAVNGKRDDFTLADFDAVAQTASMSRSRAREIVEEVRQAVAEWPAHAGDAGVDGERSRRIGAAHRLRFPVS